jgi:hypothetical protein
VRGEEEMSESTATTQEDKVLRPFFYSLEEIPERTITEVFADAEPEVAEQMHDLFGRAMVSKEILRTPELTVYHVRVPAGERVKPHRHGTYQLTYILRGELLYGNRSVRAGMGYFSPDMLYSWKAGPQGAEWLEIHGGGPSGIYTDRPQRQTGDD